MVMVTAGVCLTSCGSDDDDNGSNASLIVGTWKYSTDEYSMQYTFNSNQTGSAVEDEEGENDRWTFTYAYDSSTGRLLFSDDDEGVYTVTFRNSNTMVITDSYGDTETFTRVR